MAVGVAWFSLASLLLPAALSPALAAAYGGALVFPAVLAARFLVGFGEVSRGQGFGSPLPDPPSRLAHCGAGHSVWGVVFNGVLSGQCRLTGRVLYVL